MTSRTLHIHIDRLVVEGLAPSAQRQFLSALETQLEAHLPECARPALASGRPSQRIARVSAGEMPAGSTPQRAATQITTALRGAITGKGNTRG
jgi:hypothetical protein